MQALPNIKMNITSNVNFFKSGKSTNELIIRTGQRQFEEINIIVSNRDVSSKIPRLNPFLIQAYIKENINRHKNILNLKFTRQGKIIFTTSDPVCAVQILSMEKILDIPVSTAIIWENVTDRFLIFDIPTQTSLEELAEELTNNNDIEILEMRRFVKSNSTRDSSPVLVTILGTTIPDSIKFWFTKQKIQKFVDKPRQCMKCHSFMHPTRICTRQICHLCGETHDGQCKSPEKCINCQGPHSATSKACPHFIKEREILEFKCRNHLTTGEARRLFQQSSKSSYSNSVKSSVSISEVEETVNKKIEAIVKNISEKLEQQTNMLIEIFQKTVEKLLQNVASMLNQGESNKSPGRKKKAAKVVTQTTNIPMQWDAGGPSSSSST